MSIKTYLYRKFILSSKKVLRKLTNRTFRRVRLGDFRRLTPISSDFGYDRGDPIDRYYIENFLRENSGLIFGHVLEIGESTYTKKYGGDSVTKSDVLHVVEGNPEATIVGDLRNLPQVEDNTYDCIVITQTVHLIFEIQDVFSTLHRILKPGGNLLLTTPGLTQVKSCGWGDDWNWGLTIQSTANLLIADFKKDNIKLSNHGNVLSAACFLFGLAQHELSKRELDYCDNEYQLIITAVAKK